MKTGPEKNIYFALYILVVIVLAGIYFIVPERREFIEFNIKWWRELWQVISSFAGMMSLVI